MRLIDADKLKELLHEYCIDNDPYCQQIYDFLGIDDVIDDAYIRPYEKGYADARRKYERPTGEWISVSERKPDYTGLYLISLDDLVTSMNFDGVMFTNRSGIRIEVDAWQPLPEPYKKGAEE